MPNYDDNFFAYVNSGAINSAKEILPILLKTLKINSVLDVGCAQGAWLSVWKSLGVRNIAGLDGDYVSIDDILIDDNEFISSDLAKNFNLKQRFDLVQCLEVAEHLPEARAKSFIYDLTRHSNLILFSAAPKGQGGDHHINEQEYDYWRELFYENGYYAIDYLRPLILSNQKIEPWYKYNTFLYCSKDHLSLLPIEIREYLIDKHQNLNDLSPFTYKIRKRFVRLMPVTFMTFLAKIKERIVTKLIRNNT